MKGFDLVVEDVYAMQQTCAYEVGLTWPVCLELAEDAPVDCGTGIFQVLSVVHRERMGWV
jgi:hypothetical protein